MIKNNNVKVGSMVRIHGRYDDRLALVTEECTSGGVCDIWIKYIDNEFDTPVPFQSDHKHLTVVQSLDD